MMNPRPAHIAWIKRKGMRAALYVLVAFAIMSVFARFIANDRPLACKYHDNWLFPAFSLKHELSIQYNGTTELINYEMGPRWKTLPYEAALFPPCAYSPNSIDNENAPRKSPFSRQHFTGPRIRMPLKFRHWLGTTQNGNDVLACIVHGASVSIGIGVFSMLIAGLIGIVLGACAGYYKNNGLRTGYARVLFLLTGFLLGWFYGFEVRSLALEAAFENGNVAVLYQLLFSIAIFVIVIGGFGAAGKFLSDRILKEKGFDVPLDGIVSKATEIMSSIPALLCIIAVSVIARPSYYTLALIIGGLSWPQVARLTRAEYLKASSLDYVNACKAIGLNDWRILFRHILPNAMPVIMVQIVFGMAGATMAEAALSFIGVGVPPDVITWGALLNEAKDHFSSWWLVLCPGLCIFILILSYHSVANELTKSDTDSER